MRLSRKFGAFLFGIKFLVSFFAAVGSLGVQLYWVRDAYLAEMAIQGLVLQPVTIPKDSKACLHTSTNSRLDPGANTFLFGFSLQWDRDLPSSLVSRIGMNPVVFNAFIKITATDIQKDMITWHCQEVGKVGAMLELTVDPGQEVGTIPSQT
jgi:hypothetical protein